MEKREKFEVNVIVQMPECCKESMCDKCIENYEEQLMAEAIDAVIGDAIEGFLFIVKNVMGEETASTVVGKLECLEAIDNGKPALDMLYGMFSAAGMKPLADKLHDLILIGYECTEIYSLFMSDFFDDARIDWYLVENWFKEDFTEVPDEEMQNDCYM